MSKKTVYSKAIFRKAVSGKTSTNYNNESNNSFEVVSNKANNCKQVKISSIGVRAISSNLIKKDVSGNATELKTERNFIAKCKRYLSKKVIGILISSSINLSIYKPLVKEKRYEIIFGILSFVFLKAMMFIFNSFYVYLWVLWVLMFMKLHEVDIFDQELTCKRVVWSISDIIISSSVAIIGSIPIAILAFFYKLWCVKSLFE